MVKSALLVGFGLLGFCFCVAAQQTSRAERSKDEIAVPRPLRRSSALDAPATLTLSEQRSPVRQISVLTGDPLMLALLRLEPLPASSELDWMGMPPLDYFQDAVPNATERHKSEAASIDGKDYGKESPSEVVNSPLSPIYYSGELGVFYGRSSGKFDREITATYFLGNVGNEKFQINIGGAYEEFNGSLPRRRSFTGPR
jgi:hypothetical protein